MITTIERWTSKSTVFFGFSILLSAIIATALLMSLSGCSGQNVAAQQSDTEKASGTSEKDPASVDPAGAVASANGNQVITVETIHPKRNPDGFVSSVTQPAYVEGLFTADLMARVPGTVKYIQKNIGDPIKAGETLVELDAPDLVQGLAQKVASVEQAQQDLKAGEIGLAVAEASAKTAQSMIAQRQADEEHARALNKFHASEYNRYKLLVEREAEVGIVLDEKLRDLEAAQADLLAGQAATQTARAKFAEYSAKVEAARVDISLKKAHLAVAEADRDYAQAMVDFTQIRAPFDGLIVSRKVDPGSFVQNASTGNPTPMLRVVRTDEVTLVTWVPEKDAPFVNKNTAVTARLDALGGRELRTKVTRYSHWLDPDKSRDMRVEVDVDNKDGRLSPGMYGSMTLMLEDFSQSLLVPTSAVFAAAGETYIYEIHDGRAIRIPVKVQLEDGVQTKIVKLAKPASSKTVPRAEATEDLTEQDEIVRSGQGELSDGQSVKAVAVNW